MNIQYLLDLIIDPGHGGTDPGAVAGGKQEKDFTLMMSLYQYERAKEMGWRVGITRRDDSSLNLEQHASRVTISRARFCLCNHINAEAGLGAEAYHSLRHSPAFASAVMAELKAVGAGEHGVGVKTKESKKYPGRDYYRMHYTDITETIITEYGYIDNPKNLTMLVDNWKKYAEAALKGTAKHAGLKYTPPGTAPAVTKPQPPADPTGVVININGIIIPGRIVDNKTEAQVAPILNALGVQWQWLSKERTLLVPKK